MGKTELKGAIQHEKKRQDLSSDHCAMCGIDDVRVLQSTQVVLCAECRKKVQGQSRYEKHHIFGRQNSPLAIPIPANEHAILSDMDSLYDETDNNELHLLHWLEVFLARMLEIVRDKIASIEEKRHE